MEGKGKPLLTTQSKKRPGSNNMLPTPHLKDQVKAHVNDLSDLIAKFETCEVHDKRKLGGHLTYPPDSELSLFKKFVYCIIYLCFNPLFLLDFFLQKCSNWMLYDFLEE